MSKLLKYLPFSGDTEFRSFEFILIFKKLQFVPASADFRLYWENSDWILKSVKSWWRKVFIGFTRGEGIIRIMSFSLLSQQCVG